MNDIGKRKRGKGERNRERGKEEWKGRERYTQKGRKGDRNSLQELC